MVRLVVVADDLTGALDTGVQFAKKGVAVLASLEGDIDFASIDPDVAVLVVDTESRHVSPAEAGRKVQDTVGRARQAGVGAFYKKTDSTLRGNIGAELEAFMKALGAGRLAFVPAYPKTGRTTRGGRQYVIGVLLAESGFKGDLLEPVDESFVPAVLARQTALDVTVLSPRDPGAAAAFGGSGRGIVVFDCEDDADLVRIARILEANNALEVAAGPAGLAEILPEFLRFPAREIAVETNEGGLLVVCGSVNEVSLRQIAFARRIGFVEAAPPATVTGPQDSPGLEGRALAREAARAAARGTAVIIAAPQPAPGEPHRSTAGLLGRFAAAVLREGTFGACAVFGGDTSLAVLNALGCTRLLPRDEITPGVVLNRLAGAPAGLDFISKAGGFGEEDVVQTIVDYLRAHARPR